MGDLAMVLPFSVLQDLGKGSRGTGSAVERKCLSLAGES